MKKLIGGAALVAACGNALAGTTGSSWTFEPYAGATAERAEYSDYTGLRNDGSFSSVDYRKTTSGARLYGGADLSEHLGVELGFSQFGTASFDSQSDGSGSVWAAGPQHWSQKLSSVDLSVIGRTNIVGNIGTFVRAGVVMNRLNSDLDVTTQSVGPIRYSLNKTSYDVGLGGGISYSPVHSLRLSAAWQTVRYHGDDFVSAGQGAEALESYNLGVQYLF